MMVTVYAYAPNANRSSRASSGRTHLLARSLLELSTQRHEEREFVRQYTLIPIVPVHALLSKTATRLVKPLLHVLRKRASGTVVLLQSVFVPYVSLLQNYARRFQGRFQKYCQWILVDHKMAFFLYQWLLFGEYRHFLLRQKNRPSKQARQDQSCHALNVVALFADWVVELPYCKPPHTVSIVPLLEGF